MKSLISVIIPNYNHSCFLGKRIVSVLNQSYRNIEVIILDDKSTDNSIEIIAKYLDDKRIRGPFINEQNSGSPFLQWEKGIQMAKGEWIWIAESDDYSDPLFLETLLKHAEENDAIAAFSSLVSVDQNDKVLTKNQKSGKVRVYTPFWFSLYNCTGPLIRNTSSAIFKTSIAKEKCKEFLNYKYSGDLVFWVEFSKHGKICRCPELLAYYRMHSDSTSAVAKREGIAIQERSQYIEWMRDNCYINLFEYYLMVGEKLMELTKYAHFEPISFHKGMIDNWSKKVRFPQFSMFLYRLCNVFFRNHYTY